MILIQNTESCRNVAWIKDCMNIHHSVEFRWIVAIFLNQSKCRVRNLLKLHSYAVFYQQDKWIDVHFILC